MQHKFSPSAIVIFTYNLSCLRQKSAMRGIIKTHFKVYYNIKMQFFILKIKLILEEQNNK